MAHNTLRMRPTASGGAHAFPQDHLVEVCAALEVAGSHDPTADLDLARWLYVNWYAVRRAPVQRARGRAGAVAVRTTDRWWGTWGEPRVPATAPPALSRIYLTPRPSQVTELVRAVTAALTGTGLSWTLKVAADPETLVGPDGAVVYLPDEVRGTALWSLIPAVEGLLDPHVPPLTCRVVPGLAWSHDPGNGLSFGEHCCALIAEAVSAGPEGRASVADVAAAFRRAGLDPAAPYYRAVAYSS